MNSESPTPDRVLRTTVETIRNLDATLSEIRERQQELDERAAQHADRLLASAGDRIEQSRLEALGQIEAEREALESKALQTLEQRAESLGVDLRSNLAALSRTENEELLRHLHGVLEENHAAIQERVDRLELVAASADAASNDLAARLDALEVQLRIRCALLALGVLAVFVVGIALG